MNNKKQEMKVVDKTRKNYFKGSIFCETTYTEASQNLFEELFNEGILNENIKECEVILNAKNYGCMVRQGDFYNCDPEIRIGCCTIHVKAGSIKKRKTIKRILNWLIEFFSVKSSCTVK